MTSLFVWKISFINDFYFCHWLCTFPLACHKLQLPNNHNSLQSSIPINLIKPLTLTYWWPLWLSIMPKQHKSALDKHHHNTALSLPDTTLFSCISNNQNQHNDNWQLNTINSPPVTEEGSFYTTHLSVIPLSFKDVYIPCLNKSSLTVLFCWYSSCLWPWYQQRSLTSWTL